MGGTRPPPSRRLPPALALRGLQRLRAVGLRAGPFTIPRRPQRRTYTRRAAGMCRLHGDGGNCQGTVIRFPR